MFAEFLGVILTGVYELLLPISDFEQETMALYNALVCSVSATVITLCVGAVIQAFFAFFGAFFNFPRKQKGR